MKNNTWMKKAGVLALVVCMFLVLLPVPALANTENKSTDTIVIPKDAIYVSTPEDVLTLAENCRVNTWSAGKTVVLKNDIDMTDTGFTGIPTFGGQFAGQGFQITGIELTEEGSAKGFFRYLQKTAIVENLHIEGIVQPKGSKSAVGGIVGENAGTIRNCTFNGTVSGYEGIGAIAGINESSGLIENCTVSGMVYGSHFVGGFAGINYGVIRSCTNQAEINTKSVQNTVSIEDITLDTLVNTESAATTTDIGGIAGISNGVIRSCVNKGAIGYQSMGYNIGGIVGTQSGFVTDCTNYADIQGRKEIGGIVGHMEPNIVMQFTEDSLQKLEKQLDDLGEAMEDFENTMENSASDIEKQVSDIEKELGKIEDNLDILSHPIEKEEDELKVDEDRLTAAANNLTTSIQKVYDKTGKLENSMESVATSTEKKLNKVMKKLDNVMETLDTLGDGIQLKLEDISGNDKTEDTTGKVSACVNYGKIKGDLNIGGIAGIMAEENDLDDYEDTSLYGDFSLNVTGQVRVVVRDCKNYGTIAATKNYAGGITGQMAMGAVMESVNLGNLDALSADYVGGIAGSSSAIIRNSTSKSVIAGNKYVGGIAGEGEEVSGCYTFVSIKAYTEKAGAVLGYTEDLPELNDKQITGNYYFIEGKDIGGIDGISYAGVTDKLDLAGFLKLKGLDEGIKTVNVRFIAEGQEDVVLSVPVGESVSMDEIPTLTVDADSEYDWEWIPAVTSKVLGMGEIASKEYISEESLSNILFDQTYEVSYGLKDTVIQGSERDANNRTKILAEGTFAKNTTIAITDVLSQESLINGTELLQNWQVSVSNTGVTRLHYLLSEDTNVEAVKLFVKDTSNNWMEREFVIDGSYIVFDFVDGESGFALAENQEENMQKIMVVGAAVVSVLLLLTIVLRKGKKKNEVRKSIRMLRKLKKTDEEILALIMDEYKLGKDAAVSYLE